jgi:hypothetical protein
VNGRSGFIAAKKSDHPEYAASAFTWDFDAMEVLNGKRDEFVRNFRVPEGVFEDPGNGCPLVPGELYRTWENEEECTPGTIAWPGEVDDWMALLTTGKKIIGTANSDSHEPTSGEPGFPRTYVKVPSDRPGLVRPEHVASGLRSGDALMTYGPIIDVVVEGEDSGSMGDLVRAGAGGTVTVRVGIRSADWAPADRLEIWANGLMVASNDLEKPSNPERQEFTAELTLATDAHIEVIADGHTSLFPVIWPHEIPPLDFEDILTSIGGSFGFDIGGGNLLPSRVHKATAYALTNPVWVDVDGDGEYTPPRALPPLPESEFQTASRRTAKIGAAEMAHLKEELPRLTGAADPTATPRGAQILEQLQAMPHTKRHELLHHLPPYLWPTDHPADVRRLITQRMCKKR